MLLGEMMQGYEPKDAHQRYIAALEELLQLISDQEGDVP